MMNADNLTFVTCHTQNAIASQSLLPFRSSFPIGKFPVFEAMHGSRAFAVGSVGASEESREGPNGALEDRHFISSINPIRQP